MTDKERIAALELSNEKMREALKFYADFGSWVPITENNELFVQIHESDYEKVYDGIMQGGQRAIEALLSANPNKVAEVLKQCHEALKELERAVKRFRDYGVTKNGVHAAFMFERLPMASKALADLKDILG